MITFESDMQDDTRSTESPVPSRQFGSAVVQISVSRTLPILRLIRIPFTIAHNLARHRVGFGHREMGPSEKRLDSSTSRPINKGDGGLIIPWSQVRVLPGPPISEKSSRYVVEAGGSESLGVSRGEGIGGDLSVRLFRRHQIRVPAGSPMLFQHSSPVAVNHQVGGSSPSRGAISNLQLTKHCPAFSVTIRPIVTGSAVRGSGGAIPII
jgi:hypothetical protein